MNIRKKRGRGGQEVEVKESWFREIFRTNFFLFLFVMLASLSFLHACNGIGGTKGTTGGTDNTDIKKAVGDLLVLGKVTYPKSSAIGGRSFRALAEDSTEDAGSSLVKEDDLEAVTDAVIKLFSPDDKDFSDPLTDAIKVDENGEYEINAGDFKNAADVAKQVLVARAIFKSPITGNTVMTAALVNRTEEDKPTVDINPITFAINQKIIQFMEGLGFSLEEAGTIVSLLKTQIDQLTAKIKADGISFDLGGATEVQVSGEDAVDLDNLNVIGESVSAGAKGLVTQVGEEVIENAGEGEGKINVNIKAANKKEQTIRFLLSLGFTVETEDHTGVYVFLPIPERNREGRAFSKEFLKKLPGTVAFADKDRNFRIIKPADLADDDSNVFNDRDEIIFHLRDTLQKMPAVSAKALDALMSLKDKIVLRNLAAVIGQRFKWTTELVNYDDQGHPIFTGQSTEPETGEDVLSSELLSDITGKLGENAEKVAEQILEKDYQIFNLAERVINEKIHKLQDCKGTSVNRDSCKKKMDVFFKTLDDEEKVKKLVKDSDVFSNEKGRIEHQVFAAISKSLYNKRISESTELNYKETLFVLLLMVDRPYLIDNALGWIVQNEEGFYNPYFENFKRLEPKEGELTFTDVLTDLGIRDAEKNPISDGTEYGELVEAIYAALEKIERPEEFKQIEFQDNQFETVTLHVSIKKNHDTPLEEGAVVQLLPMECTGTGRASRCEPSEDNKKEGTVVGVDGNVMVGETEGFEGVKANMGYQLKIFDKDNNFLFDFPMFVDGFNDHLYKDFVIPQHAEFGRADFPMIPLILDDKTDEGVSVGADFSAFKEGKGFIVPENNGADLFWVTTDGAVALKVANGAKIGKLEGNGIGQVMEKVFGKEESNNLLGSSILGSELFAKEDNRIKLGTLLLLADGTGTYYVLEVTFIELDQNGNPNGKIDFKFAQIGRDGKIERIKEAFTPGFVGQGQPGQPGGQPSNNGGQMELHFGDYMDLNTGGISAPEGMDFGVNSEVIAAADIRWEATAFENEMPGNNEITAINGAKIAKVEIGNVEGKCALTLPDAEDDFSESVTIEGEGAMLVVRTADNSDFLLAISIHRDSGSVSIGYTKVDLTKGLVDNDADCVPQIMDPNDFDPNMPGRMQIGQPVNNQASSVLGSVNMPISSGQFNLGSGETAKVAFIALQGETLDFTRILSSRLFVKDGRIFLGSEAGLPIPLREHFSKNEEAGFEYAAYALVVYSAPLTGDVALQGLFEKGKLTVLRVFIYIRGADDFSGIRNGWSELVHDMNSDTPRMVGIPGEIFVGGSVGPQPGQQGTGTGTGGFFITSSIPARGMFGVDVNSPITVNFSREIQMAGDMTNAVVLKDMKGLVIPGRISGGGVTITFESVQPLAFDTPYTLTILNIKDLENRNLEGERTIQFRTAGQDSLSVSYTYPEEGSMGLDINTSITVSFSRQIMSSLPQDAILLKRMDGTVVPGSINSDGWSLYFKPQDPLSYGTSYNVIISGIAGVDGHRLDKPKTLQFTTVGQDALSVSYIYPEHNNTGIDVNASITISFNRQIKMISLPQDAIILKGADGMPVPGTIDNDSWGTLYFKPQQALQSKTTYTLIISKIVDFDGKGLDKPKTIQFETAAESVLDLSYTYPAHNTRGIDVNTSITVSFNRKINMVTLPNDAIVLTGSDGVVVPGSIDGDGWGTLYFTLQQPLKYDTAYSLVISRVTDENDKGLDKPKLVQFRTGLAEALVVTSTSLPDDVTALVDINTTINVNFNRDININPIPTGAIVLKETDGFGVFVSGHITGDNTTLSFTPEQALKYDTAYTLIVSNIFDMSGKGLESPRVIQFKTVTQTQPQTGTDWKTGALKAALVPALSGAPDLNNVIADIDVVPFDSQRGVASATIQAQNIDTILLQETALDGVLQGVFVLMVHPADKDLNTASSVGELMAIPNVLVYVVSPEIDSGIPGLQRGWNVQTNPDAAGEPIFGLLQKYVVMPQ